MFSSLRSKLVVSYVALVLLALMLTSVATVWLIIRTQERTALTRVEATARTTAQRLVGGMVMRPLLPVELDRFISEGGRLSIRLLLLDRRGEVLTDSGRVYMGQVVPPPREPLRPLIASRGRLHIFGDGREYVVVHVGLPEQAGEAGRAAYLVVAVEMNEVGFPWREMLLPLGAAAAAVILAALGLAFVLANSITRPIVQMERAAGEIARGHYQQAIVACGSDEVATLARAFTRMAQEVARTQQAQRDFLANISHDLKTPLTSIQGFSQAILEGAITDKQGYHRAAEIINGEAERMVHLVQDLLELARLEGRQLDLAPQPVPLAQLLRSELQKVYPRAEKRSLEIVSILPDELASVVADVHRLEQALANLLDNAVKYARPGTRIVVEGEALASGALPPPPLTVAFGKAVEEGAWVWVSVANQGEVIPGNALGRIFERFYRGDKSRQGAEGSGLGLAIVRETALAHGGRIEASSDAEQGTRFRLWLPLAGPGS